MSWDDVDAHFDRFASTVFRLETLQDYREPESVAAFLRGLPRPERSVRTSPWLARIAVTTATEGKHWQRVRVVEEPLTDYTKYEIAGYVESQAAGEEIRIARRAAHEYLPSLTRDFWLFDAGTPGAFALLMEYSDDGRWLDAHHTTDPAVLEQLEAEREFTLRWSVPLNEYLAQRAKQAA